MKSFQKLANEALAVVNSFDKSSELESYTYLSVEELVKLALQRIPAISDKQAALTSIKKLASSREELAAAGAYLLATSGAAYQDNSSVLAMELEKRADLVGASARRLAAQAAKTTARRTARRAAASTGRRAAASTGRRAAGRGASASKRTSSRRKAGRGAPASRRTAKRTSSRRKADPGFPWGRVAGYGALSTAGGALGSYLVNKFRREPRSLRDFRLKLPYAADDLQSLNKLIYEYHSTDGNAPIPLTPELWATIRAAINEHSRRQMYNSSWYGQ